MQNQSQQNPQGMQLNQFSKYLEQAGHVKEIIECH
jgi:hypothetical protein